MPEAAPLERTGEDGLPAPLARWGALAAVTAGLLAAVIVRTVVARTVALPRLSDLFTLGIVACSLWVVVAGRRRLTRLDWLVALGLGLIVGAQLPFATLFRPYPFLGLRGGAWQALARGACTAAAALGGLVVMRSGGPVRVHLADGTWRRALGGVASGVLVGLPLAVLNAFANAWVQGQAFDWQRPLAAAVDALQPALVEEVVYRLALLGLLWLVLRGTWPDRQAAWLAGLLSLLVHAYGAHLSDEFITQPLEALAMGAVMGLIWGVPLTVLALRRGLDAAVGFHWAQDFARFWVGL